MGIFYEGSMSVTIATAVRVDIVGKGFEIPLVLSVTVRKVQGQARYPFTTCESL